MRLTTGRAAGRGQPLTGVDMLGQLRDARTRAARARRGVDGVHGCATFRVGC